MKHFKKLCACLAVCLAAAAVLGACRPTDTEEPAGSAVVVSAADSSGSVQKLQQTFSNGLTIDAAVEVAPNIDQTAAKVVSVDPKPLDIDTAASVLLQSREITDRQTVNVGATAGGNETPAQQYFAADGSSLYVDPATGSLSFETPLSQSLSYAYWDNENDSNYNRDAYQQDSLPFMTKEQAIANVQEALQKIGLPSQGQVDVVALDRETLQKEAVDPAEFETKPDTAPEKKETWTEDDECYVLYLHPEIEGIRMDANVAPDVAQRPEMVVYYGKDGIVSLNGAAYQETDDPVKTQPVVSAETAMKAFSDQYSAIPAQDGMEINASAIRLEYLFRSAGATTDTKELTPCWNITASITTKDHHADGTFFVHVDAITGKLIT